MKTTVLFFMLLPFSLFAQSSQPTEASLMVQPKLQNAGITLAMRLAPGSLQ